MWAIKNRVTEEWDSKGIRPIFHKVARGAWASLNHAKTHVAVAIRQRNADGETAFNWYRDAVFMEFTEEGIGQVIPVADYLKEYLQKTVENPYHDKRYDKWLEVL